MWKKSKQKQNQVKSHSKWPRVLLFDLAHEQRNGIIKGWLHCQTLQWKGRFLVNAIYLVQHCVVMAEIQFSLIKKKIKIGRPEHSLTSQPPKFDNISFLPYPPPPVKVDVRCVSPLGRTLKNKKPIKIRKAPEREYIFSKYSWNLIKGSLRPQNTNTF